MPNVRAYSSAVRIRWLDDHRLAVVAHRHRARADQLAELGELLALLPERDRADRVDPRLPRPLRLAHDEADGRLVVGDRIGVGHGADRGESAGRRRHRAPVATVSTSSWPGSRRCTCRSMSPGATTCARRLDDLGAVRAARDSGPSPRPSPSCSSRSATPVDAAATGSSTRPPRMQDRPHRHSPPCAAARQSGEPPARR